ncbi:hypothetical protein JCM10213_001786 [Rhodosporidiobolus nylandii]
MTLTTDLSFLSLAPSTPPAGTTAPLPAEMDPSLRAVLEEIGCLDWEEMPVPTKDDFLGDYEDWKEREQLDSQTGEVAKEGKEWYVLPSLVASPSPAHQPYAPTQRTH